MFYYHKYDYSMTQAHTGTPHKHKHIHIHTDVHTHKQSHNITISLLTYIQILFPLSPSHSMTIPGDHIPVPISLNFLFLKLYFSIIKKITTSIKI